MIEASRRPLAVLAPALLLVGSGVLGAACLGTDEHSERPAIFEVTVVDANVQRGAELFAKHCAVCHGATGAGDGQAADALSPVARDFTSGNFRLVSTRNGVPSRDDLVSVLERGMPGSAMPAWSWMSPSDLDQLAAYVRHLAVEGIAHDIDTAALVEGHPIAWEDAHAEAVARMTPGERVDPGRPAAPTPAVLARGAALFQERCASCHGEDGKGRGDEPRVDDSGNLTWARDFTAGILKGGAAYEDLACRVLTGLPGSSMPATALAQEDLASLVAYVQSLVPDGAETRHVLRRELIRALHTTAPAPLDPDDPRWGDAPETKLALAPLWWSAGSVFEAKVAALHDGEVIALRLAWLDPSREDARIGGRPYSDAAALMFSSEVDPPLFGMGSRLRPMNLWHWRASRWDELSGILDLDAPQPHAVREPGYDSVRVDAPLYLAAPEISSVSDRTESLEAVGVGELNEAGAEASTILTQPVWKEGEWTVVFQRRMQTTADGEIVFSPRDRLQVVFAIWNGAAGDRRGRKSISIWQLLAIEPNP